MNNRLESQPKRRRRYVPQHVLRARFDHAEEWRDRKLYGATLTTLTSAILFSTEQTGWGYGTAAIAVLGVVSAVPNYAEMRRIQRVSPVPLVSHKELDRRQKRMRNHARKTRKRAA